MCGESPVCAGVERDTPRPAAAFLHVRTAQQSRPMHSHPQLTGGTQVATPPTSSSPLGHCP